MSSVDHMDGIRAVAPTRRRDRLAYVPIFSWILYLDVNNGYAVYNELKREDCTLPAINFRDFKLGIIDSLAIYFPFLCRARDAYQIQ